MRRIVVGIFMILGIWLFLYYSRIVSPALLPSPLSSVARIATLVVGGNLNQDLQSTAYRWLIGYGGGLMLGVPVGLLMGSSPLFYQLVEFPVDFFRSLPVTAMFPLFLLAFGIGDESKIAMVWVAVFFISIVNSAYGALRASKTRLQMAKTFGASDWQIFRDVTAWEAVPQTFVGIRIALSNSLIVVIVSEMFLGTEYGLGQRVFDAYSKNVVEELYGMLLLIGVIGYLLNKLLVVAEQKMLFWVGK